MMLSSISETIESYFKSLTAEQILIMVGIGLVAGFLAKAINNSKGGVIVTLIIGIAGSFIGPLILEAFQVEGLGAATKLVASFVGACIFAWVSGKFSN